MMILNCFVFFTVNVEIIEMIHSWRAIEWQLFLVSGIVTFGKHCIFDS